MEHLKAINEKAGRIERHTSGADEASRVSGRASGADAASDAPSLDVHALQNRPSGPPQGPHIPLGCSLVFAPGWEVDSSGGTAGLCQPVERDLFDCHLACFWPAHVPDQLNHAPDWTGKCASAQQDWRNIDLIFP